MGDNSNVGLIGLGLVGTALTRRLIGAGIKSLLKENTCAVFCEAPGSLSFEMQDIPAIAREAHAHNIPVLADTTWGTPYFFRSFDAGIDVSIHEQAPALRAIGAAWSSSSIGTPMAAPARQAAT